MIKINSIGYNWIHDNEVFFMHRPQGNQDYLFLLIRSKANIFAGAEAFHTNSPAIFIYKKGSEHKYGESNEPFINDWFHFDSENENELESFLETLGIPLQTPVYINDIQTISNLIRDLEYEYRQPGLFQKNLIDTKIRALFYKMAGILHQEKHIPYSLNKYRIEFTNIRNKIYNLHELQGIRSIPMLVGQLNMSVSHFHHVYKILFHSSPGQDIIKSRISYACILLSSENISISDISEKCQYSNVEHFIRQFKQYMKCTPGEYRSSHRI